MNQLFDPDFRRQGGEFLRRVDLMGNNSESLVHEEQERSMQPEELFEFVEGKQHGESVLGGQVSIKFDCVLLHCLPLF